MNGNKVTNTMHPILKNKMPKDKQACCLQWVANIWLQQQEMHHVKMTATWNLLKGTYNGKTSSETANINTV